MSRRHLGGDDGFTLAEILTATAVIAIGLVATAVAFQHGLASIEVGRKESTAVFLAEHKLEELKGLALVDWLHGALEPGTTTEYCEVASLDCTAAPVLPTFRRTTTVANGAGGACSSRCKIVRVTVFYRAITGAGYFDQERRVDLATMFVSRS